MTSDGMREVNLIVPEGLEFADLKLSRDAVSGAVSFDWEPIEALCAANGIDAALFRDRPEDAVAGLIVGWYFAARRLKGAHDPVAEMLLAEVLAEDTFGEASVQRGPGRAQ